MAGLDYINCNECGNRLIYDGDRKIRNAISSQGNTLNITCDMCVNRLNRKIDKLKKHDRRRK